MQYYMATVKPAWAYYPAIYHTGGFNPGHNALAHAKQFGTFPFPPYCMWLCTLAFINKRLWSESFIRWIDCIVTCRGCYLWSTTELYRYIRRLRLLQWNPCGCIRCSPLPQLWLPLSEGVYGRRELEWNGSSVRLYVQKNLHVPIYTYSNA